FSWPWLERLNNILMKNPESKIWYKEPYVWLLILIPFSAVIMGLIMVFLAINTDDGLVVDDYYKKGLEINMALERDRAARSYGIKADFVVDKTGKLITLILEGNEKLDPPITLHARYIHRTRGRFDREIIFTRSNRDGNYYAVMPELARGNWDILIEANDWRKFLDYTVK